MTNEQDNRQSVDYIRVLRQHGLLVSVITLLCTIAAIGVSAIQKRTYTAQASLSVSDPSQALSLLGGTGATNGTPDQLAAAHLSRVTRPVVARRVAAALHHVYTASQLTQLVSTHVDPSSNLVLVDAHAGNAADAAAIANGFAQQDAAQSNFEARQTFAQAASNLAQKIRSLGAANNSTTRLIYIDQLSRLQSLSAVAAPVQVTGAAQVPGSPSSPKPVRDGLIGFLLGLLLGMATVYTRRLLDRRLRTPHDIEEQMGFPVVGAVRSEALGRAGTVSNGLGPLENTDLESFRIIRQNVEFLDVDQTARCIVVTSAVAQEGKSTVAAGLAMASAALGKLTLLLECDLRRPVLAKRFGLAESPGLTDYLVGRVSPEDVTQVVENVDRTGPMVNGGQQSRGRVAVDEGRNLVCITAGAEALQPAELLGSGRFRTLLSQLREVYEVVIVDSSPLLLVADTLELLPQVSDVVLCVRCDQTTRDEAEAARACLGRLPAKPVGVVATGMRPGIAGYYGYGYNAYSASRDR